MSKPCSYCATEGGNIPCEACVDFQGSAEIATPLYCSTVCKDADRSRHDNVCQAHQQILSRAVNTVESVWQVALDNAFEYRVDKPQFSSYRDQNWMVVKRRPRRDFYVGKAELDHIEPQHRHAVTAINKCVCSVVVMGDLLCALLESTH